jgi:hypothetical protein
MVPSGDLGRAVTCRCWMLISADAGRSAGRVRLSDCLSRGMVVVRGLRSEQATEIPLRKTVLFQAQEKNCEAGRFRLAGLAKWSTM